MKREKPDEKTNGKIQKTYISTGTLNKVGIDAVVLVIKYGMHFVLIAIILITGVQSGKDIRPSQ